jgi:phage host-nuclease inhibitor protein Gam
MATTKKPVTQAAYETALKAYVGNENKKASLTAKWADEIQKLREKYEPQVNELAAANPVHFDVVMQYCEENRETLFTAGKSIEAFGATLAYRTGTDKVEILPAYDEKAVVAGMQNKAAYAPYLNVTYSLNKAKIIAEQPKWMPKVGLMVTGSELESFSIKIIPAKKEKKK